MKNALRDIAASILGTGMAILCVGSFVTITIWGQRVNVIMWRHLEGEKWRALQAVVKFLVTGEDMPPEVDAAAERRLGYVTTAIAVFVVVTYVAQLAFAFIRRSGG